MPARMVAPKRPKRDNAAVVRQPIRITAAVGSDNFFWPAVNESTSGLPCRRVGIARFAAFLRGC